VSEQPNPNQDAEKMRMIAEALGYVDCIAVVIPIGKLECVFGCHIIGHPTSSQVINALAQLRHASIKLTSIMVTELAQQCDIHPAVIVADIRDAGASMVFREQSS